MKGQKWPLTGEAMVEDLPLSAKHYLALKNLIKEYNLDGIAVRCWPELPNSKEFDGGAWCYLALARLASEGNEYSIPLKLLLYVVTKNTKNAFFTCFCPYVRQPHDHIG